MCLIRTTPLPAFNPPIEAFEIVGGLTGSGALEIQRYLCTCLDECRCYQIINFEHVNKIDGLGIAILENFMSRGLQIRLINVKPEIQGMIRMAKKESLFNIMHNEKDLTKAASLLEKDISEKKVIPGDGLLKKRQHIRVNAPFPSEFKYYVNGEATLCSANILNLSEGGILAGQIVAVDKNTQQTVKCQGMAEQEIYDLKFRLNGDSMSVTAQGICVREFMVGQSLHAGIRFKDISQHHREIIRSFVDAHK